MPYYLPHTSAVEMVYNTFLREGPFTHILHAAPRTYPVQYGMMRNFFAREFPWSLVRPGQTVIQVSSASSLIPVGRSHALMLATLVGPSGRVIVVEPDPENVRALRSYCAREGVRSIEIIERAIWNERGARTFASRPKSSGWHRLMDTVEEGDAQRFGGEFIRRIVVTDTIDHLVEELQCGDPAFINMTINGCEPEAFAGMHATLARSGCTLTFPLQNRRTMQSLIIADLEALGYTVLLKHAPVATKQRQFIVAAAVRHPSAGLMERAEPVRIAATVRNGRDFLSIVPLNTDHPVYEDGTFRAQIRWL